MFEGRVTREREGVDLKGGVDEERGLERCGSISLHAPNEDAPFLSHGSGGHTHDLSSLVKLPALRYICHTVLTTENRAQVTGAQ